MIRGTVRELRCQAGRTAAGLRHGPSRAGPREEFPQLPLPHRPGHILTSEMNISSISASVGAFSKTLGLGRGVLESEWERSMQEVDFTLLEQAFTMQGREPNPLRARGERERAISGGEGTTVQNPNVREDPYAELWASACHSLSLGMKGVVAGKKAPCGPRHS